MNVGGSKCDDMKGAAMNATPPSPKIATQNIQTHAAPFDAPACVIVVCYSIQSTFLNRGLYPTSDAPACVMAIVAARLFYIAAAAMPHHWVAVSVCFLRSSSGFCAI